MRMITVFLLLLASVPARAETVPMQVLDAEFWAAPRSAASVAAHPVLRDLVQRLDTAPGATLLIRYPGGETGQLQAQELRAWLVSLGLPSSRVDTQPGGTLDERLQLAVQP